MKKILLSLFAVAALFSCSKSDITYDQEQSEIGFAPYSKMISKSAVITTDYPDALNMYVFANAGTDGAALSTFDEPYFANAEFAHGYHATNVFGGVTPYYWPNVKELIFSGYSKSGNVASLNPKPTYAKNETTKIWEINMTGYAPTSGTATLGDNDLMWFPTTTESYAKPASAYFTVDVVMQHACSWVTINIKGDAITGAENTTWQILDLTIADLAQKGDVVLGTEASWNNLSEVKVFDVYEETTGKALTTDYVDYTKLTYQDFILIPQATKTLTVRYSYVSQAGGAANGSDIVIEETKNIPLTYTDDEGWKPGVHYTYNITIGTQEILIEPTVKVWETVTAPDVVL